MKNCQSSWVTKRTDSIQLHTSLEGCAKVKTCTTFWGSILGRTYHKRRRVCRKIFESDTRRSRKWSNTTSQNSARENSSDQAARELTSVWRDTSSNMRSWQVPTNQGKMVNSICLLAKKEARNVLTAAYVPLRKQRLSLEKFYRNWLHLCRACPGCC